MRYRRAQAKGGTYFFTVNLADRSPDPLVRRIGDLAGTLEESIY
jgi:putative transposase